MKQDTKSSDRESFFLYIFVYFVLVFLCFSAGLYLPLLPPLLLATSGFFGASRNTDLAVFVLQAKRTCWLQSAQLSHQTNTRINVSVFCNRWLDEPRGMRRSSCCCANQFWRFLNQISKNTRYQHRHVLWQPENRLNGFS